MSAVQQSALKGLLQKYVRSGWESHIFITIILVTARWAFPLHFLLRPSVSGSHMTGTWAAISRWAGWFLSISWTDFSAGCGVVTASSKSKNEQFPSASGSPNWFKDTKSPSQSCQNTREINCLTIQDTIYLCYGCSWCFEPQCSWV